MMTYGEAVGVLERHGIKVSLLQGLGVLRQCAEVIRSFEERFSRVATVLETANLKDGDVLVLKCSEKDMPDQHDLHQVAEKLKQMTGGKKILLLALPEDADLSVMSEAQRALLKSRL